jgi:hypothetical protein
VVAASCMAAATARIAWSGVVVLAVVLTAIRKFSLTMSKQGQLKLTWVSFDRQAEAETVINS